MANNTELDVIKHLLEIEKQASILIDDAKKESEKKLSEVKLHFNAEYKEKYEILLKKLEDSYLKQKEDIVVQHNKQIQEFKKSWQDKKQNVEAFNKMLDSLLF